MVNELLVPTRTQLEAIVALTQGSAGLIDAEGRIVYLTSSLLGYSLESLYGQNIFGALAPGDLPFAREQFERCLHEPDTPIQLVIRKAHQDGSTRVIEAVLLNKLANPEVRAIVLQYRDVTAVKAIQERHAADQRRSAILSEITELLAESFDSSNILQKLAVCAVDSFADFCIVYRLLEDGHIRRAAAAHADPDQAPTIEQIVGLDVEGESAVTLRDIIESGESQLTENLSPVFQRVPPGPVQDVFRKLAAKSSIVAPLTARGRRMGALAVGLSAGNRCYTKEDLRFVQELARRAAIAIDNERLYREAQEGTRLRDEFLAAISHELRTPLTAIAGWAAILRKMDAAPEMAERALQSIERNVKLQTSLIDDLLDGSRIVTGKMRLNLATADLIPIIRSVVENMQVSADAKNIEMICSFGVRHAFATCDANRIEQIFWNLLSNAIKFTPMNGHITVRIEAIGAEASQVIISDTGAGISNDFLPHVFEQFRQFDASSSRRTGGLGLGLAIVKHLVDLHGGTVRAESRGIGQGATFRVVLPTQVIDRAVTTVE